MKGQHRLTGRGSRGGNFYSVDSTSCSRTSLKTDDRDTARRIIAAKNNAERQPAINLQLAKAYLAATNRQAGNGAQGASPPSLPMASTGQP